MAINNLSDSPRQKMINLMYIVLMAMLALNISSDVLEGFSLVDEGLARTTTSLTERNQLSFNEFAATAKDNPAKAEVWFEKARKVKQLSDSLYIYIDGLKQQIVHQADGKRGDVSNIKNKEDLEAASSVMLSPVDGQGEILLLHLNSYREEILELIEDTGQRTIIQKNLSTEIPSRENTIGKRWPEYMFESTPAIAAVTLLSKLQSDIRYAEGEILHSLTDYIDNKDLRVNQLKAFVIPGSEYVVRGNKITAQVLLAAIDSTRRPDVFINGEKLSSENMGYYETVANRTGDFLLEGYLQLNEEDNPIRLDFSRKYTVVEPSATVSATLMNVLYAGYDNPLSISVPGAPGNRVSATLANNNGTLRRTNTGYIINPARIGEDAIIRVSATVDGEVRTMGNYTFQVRKLPDPSPFINYVDSKGEKQRYSGGTGLNRTALQSANGITAAIDDGLLNIDFRVLGFETVFFDNMGNAVPEISAGSSFSSRQKDMFRRLTRGQRFYISRVRAVGPDGIERILRNTLEVIII